MQNYKPERYQCRRRKGLGEIWAHNAPAVASPIINYIPYPMNIKKGVEKEYIVLNCISV